MSFVVFLDVDGVLNKQSDWKRPFSLNDECCYWFNTLIKDLPNVKIVLSSTWRNGIARDGSIFKALQSLIFKMPIPELAIKMPPTMHSSAIISSEKKEPDKFFATR